MSESDKAVPPEEQIRDLIKRCHRTEDERDEARAEIARLTADLDAATKRAERAEAVMEALYAALESKDAATTITVYEIREALLRREGA